MKKMRRMISILMVLAMLLGMPVAALVEGVEEPAVVEQTPAEQPVVEEPTVEAPAAEAPAAEEPQAEAPAAEEPAVEEPAVEEPAAEEPVAEEPVAEEPVAEEPAVEEPVVEEPVVEEPVTEEPVTEEPVGEEPVAEEPVTEEPVAEEPVVEEPVVEEPVAEEPAVEEPAAEVEAFAGSLRIRVHNEDDLRLGGNAILVAYVTKANMSYSVLWQSKTTAIKDEPWKDIIEGDIYELPITTAAFKLTYRCVVTAKDGTKLIEEYRLPVSLLQNNESEPIAEEPVVEEPVVEEPAVEEPVTEEPVVEEPVVEEPVTEEPVAEEPVVEEPVIEEPVTEEPVVEEPAVEEPVVEEPAVEEPAAEVEPKKVESNHSAAETVKADEATETEAAPTEEEPAATVFNFAAAPVAEPEAQDQQTITLEGTEDEEFQEVNVREGADGLAAIFTSLPEGAEVTVIGVNGDWVSVTVDGQKGYIYKEDIAGYLDLPEEEPAEADAPKAEPKVTIFTSRRTVMEVGEPVYLTSKLEGFEDYTEFMYIWYCDKGNGFEEVPGANEPNYTFPADSESLTWGWQLEVLCR